MLCLPVAHILFNFLISTSLRLIILVKCRVTGTFIRTAPSYTIIDKSLVQWRRPAYRELQITSGPVRFTINSNYEYVSDYV